MAPRTTPDILAGLDAPSVGDDAVAVAMGPQVWGLDIAVIRTDGGTQPRAGIDQDVVREYAEDMARGAEFPPVQVVHDGRDYWLWDGFHRLHARQQAGQRTTPALVRQGTRREAVLLSVGANATHGFRRTADDKRRAVDTLLHDQEWSQWSDREIARRAAVDGKTVAARRAFLSAEIPQIETRRVTRNGSEYMMATPQRSAAPAQASQEQEFLTLSALEAQARRWAEEWEEPEGALAGLAEELAAGRGEYLEDWRQWVNGRWRKQDLLLALRWISQAQGPSAPAPATPTVAASPQPAEARQEQVIDWRAARATITEDGRVLVRLHDGTRNPPWLELDDAGQHWMLDLIRRAQGE